MYLYILANHYSWALSIQQCEFSRQVLMHSIWIFQFDKISKQLEMFPWRALRLDQTFFISTASKRCYWTYYCDRNFKKSFLEFFIINVDNSDTHREELYNKATFFKRSYIQRSTESKDQSVDSLISLQHKCAHAYGLQALTAAKS